MSGSYQQLLQKYNQLLALVLNLPAGSDTLQAVINANDELQGSPPALDQVIKYDGTNVVWGTDGGTQDLDQVLTVGNTTTLGATFTSGTESTLIDGTGITYIDTSSGVNTYVTNIITVENTAGTIQTNISETEVQVLDSTTSELATMKCDSIKIVDNVLFPVFTEITKNKISISDINTVQSIEIDKSLVGNQPRITLTDGTLLIDSKLDTSSLIFSSGIITPTTVGISVVGTGLNVKTNGTLTFQDLTGSDGQFLKYNSLGNAVWDSLPTIPTVKASSVVIPAGDATGTISFGFTFTSAPTVIISQVTSGNIVALSIVSTTTTGFTWKSTAPGVGNINWIATL